MTPETARNGRGALSRSSLSTALCLSVLVCVIASWSTDISPATAERQGLAQDQGLKGGGKSDAAKSIRRDSEETVSAVASAGSGDLYAFLVGVSKYKDPRIPPLRVAEKDALDFAKFLETQRELFKNVRVTVLTNEQATKSALEKYLLYDLRKVGKRDTIVLFFSGHGAIDPKRPGEFFFLTHEADPDFLGISSVNMTGLSFLKELDCPRVVLIADACHAGGFSRTGTKLAVVPVKKFMSDFSSSAGRVIMTSSRPEEYSLEKQNMGNGLFTHFFLEGLKGAADSDGNGVVSVNEAYQYAYERTKTESEGVQHPQFEGTVEGIFPLAVVGDLGDRPSTTLDLFSNTPAADVFVNGRFVGKTDSDGSLCLKYLPVGRAVSVKLAKEGWVSQTMGPFVFEDEKLYIKSDPVTLRPALSSLEVITDPGGVNVSIDGKRVGATSRDGRLIVHGLQVAVPHTLELTRDGHQPESVVVSIPVSHEGKKFAADKTRLAQKEKEKGRPAESSDRQRSGADGASTRSYSRPEPREEPASRSRESSGSDSSSSRESSRFGL
jgi:hypothetical protein